MKTRIALLIAALLLAPAVNAAEPPPPPPEGRFCDEHVARCEEMRLRYDKWCKRNPNDCRAAQQRREARRDRCRQNPEECYEEMRERREARMEHCRANPVDCEDRFHDEQRWHREHRQAMRRHCAMHPDRCGRMDDAEARDDDTASAAPRPRVRQERSEDGGRNPVGSALGRDHAYGGDVATQVHAATRVRYHPSNQTQSQCG